MSLFVLAGEPSGDLHGQKVMQALRKIEPALEIHGIGGPKMRAAGLRTLLPMEEFQMMGFTGILGGLPRLIKHFNQVLGYIQKMQPAGVLLIDYPGFNLRLAKALRKKGYRGKIIQFICPQVWMWFKGDIKIMIDHFDLLLSIFPFEPAIFEKSSLPTKYIGHPSVEIIEQHVYAPHEALFPDTPILGIFPGSRPGVIKRNFPLQLKAARQLQNENSALCIGISVANTEAQQWIRSQVDDKVLLFPEKYSYDLMRASTFAIATSGTVSLELALHQTPTIVTSAYSTFDCFIAKNIFGVVPPCCIVNILAKKMVFPELFYREHTIGNIFKEARALYHNENLRERCRVNCKEIKEMLFSLHSPTQNAAFLVLDLLSRQLQNSFTR